jgi:hypothetical protein
MLLDFYIIVGIRSSLYRISHPSTYTSEPILLQYSQIVTYRFLSLAYKYNSTIIQQY